MEKVSYQLQNSLVTCVLACWPTPNSSSEYLRPKSCTTVKQMQLPREAECVESVACLVCCLQVRAWPTVAQLQIVACTRSTSQSHIISSQAASIMIVLPFVFATNPWRSSISVLSCCSSSLATRICCRRQLSSMQNSTRKKNVQQGNFAPLRNRWHEVLERRLVTRILQPLAPFGPSFLQS